MVSGYSLCLRTQSATTHPMLLSLSKIQGGMSYLLLVILIWLKSSRKGTFVQLEATAMSGYCQASSQMNLVMSFHSDMSDPRQSACYHRRIHLQHESIPILTFNRPVRAISLRTTAITIQGNRSGTNSSLQYQLTGGFTASPNQRDYHQLSHWRYQCSKRLLFATGIQDTSLWLRLYWIWPL